MAHDFRRVPQRIPERLRYFLAHGVVHQCVGPVGALDERQPKHPVQLRLHMAHYRVDAVRLDGPGMEVRLGPGMVRI